MNRVLIKLNVTNEDVNLSPLAFGSIFTNLELLLEMSDENNFIDVDDVTHNIITQDISDYILKYTSHKSSNDYSAFISKDKWVTLNSKVSTIDNKNYILNKVGYALIHKDDDNILEINVNLSRLE